MWLKRNIGFVIVVSLGLLVAGCSAKDEMDSAPSSYSGSAEPSGASATPTSTGASYSIPSRSIVRQANVSLRVDEVEVASRALSSKVASMGGYVSASTLGSLGSENPQARLEVRVPSAKFDKALEAIREVGTLLGLQITTEDVTGSLFDMEARLATLRATEESIRTLLGRPGNLDQTIAIREKLAQVRGEIEALAAQRKALSDSVTFSRIQIDLSQSAKAGYLASKDTNWLSESWASSVVGLSSVLREVGSGAVAIAVYSPLWLPPFAGLYWLVRRKRLQSASPAAEVQFRL